MKSFRRPASRHNMPPQRKRPATSFLSPEQRAKVNEVLDILKSTSFGKTPSTENTKKDEAKPTMERVLQLYLNDTSPLPGIPYCKCYRGINGQAGDESPEGCCAGAARVLCAYIQHKVDRMDYWMLNDGDEVDAEMHQISGALSFVLPHVKGSLAYKKAVDLRPLLPNLKTLSKWAEGNLDDDPFSRHIGYLTATSTYSKPMVVEDDKPKKRRRSSR